MIETINKIINLRGSSMIENQEAAMFEATLNSSNPVILTMNMHVVNEDVYRDNIALCRKDEDSFREYVQSLQDELLSNNTTETETEAAEQGV